MIESKELRLGNWINCHFQTTNFNAKVLAIDLTNNIAVKDGNNIDWYGSQGNIDPVPLTPAILEAAGFEQGARGSVIRCWIKGKFVLNEHDGFHLQLSCLTNLILIEIKPVHHLQNCFFSLTGEELEIKMPIS